MPRSRFMPDDFELTDKQREHIKTKYGIDDAEVDRQLEHISEWEFKDPKSDWYRTTLVWIRRADTRGDLRRPRKYTSTAVVPTESDRSDDQAKFEEEMKRYGVSVVGQKK